MLLSGFSLGEDEEVTMTVEKPNTRTQNLSVKVEDDNTAIQQPKLTLLPLIPPEPLAVLSPKELLLGNLRCHIIQTEHEEDPPPPPSITSQWRELLLEQA